MNLLEVLNLEKMNISDEEICISLFNCLSKISSLREVNLSNNALKSHVTLIFDVLLNNKSLKKLILENCLIDDEAFSFFEKIFLEIETLTCLNLNNNLITDLSCNVFKDFLVKNQSLNLISLLNNKIRYSSIKKLINSSDKKRLLMED
jgi:hypothetical protein